MKIDTTGPGTASRGIESITEANLAEERDSVDPQADGDSSELNTVPADGRISCLPPDYDESDEGDSPALDAEIQGESEESR